MHAHMAVVLTRVFHSIYCLVWNLTRLVGCILIRQVFRLANRFIVKGLVNLVCTSSKVIDESVLDNFI